MPISIEIPKIKKISKQKDTGRVFGFPEKKLVQLNKAQF